MSDITAEELGNRLVNGSSNQPIILDIRSEEEFEDWHIPESTNINVYETLKDNPDQARSKLETLPNNEEIVTVCAGGVVSQQATEVLLDMGYDARTLLDGMKGWSRVHLTATLDIDGPARILQVARPGTGCLSYVVISDGGAVVVDPSQFTTNYESIIDDEGIKLTGVLETHAHADHISGGEKLSESNSVPLYRHRDDQGRISTLTPLEDGETLEIGDSRIDVIHTPGHTPGSVVFNVDGEILLTGDTLFFERVGRPDLEGEEKEVVRNRTEALYDSLQRILNHSSDVLIGPAHDSDNPFPPKTASLEETLNRNEPLNWNREEFIERVMGSIPDPPANYKRIKRINKGIEPVDEDEGRDLELGPNRCAAG